jgi:hypothetical protein
MTKFDQSQYLVNLLAIMASRDAAGAVGRGRLLPDEYERVYKEFTSTIRKEQEDEARKSADKVRADESRAPVEGRVTGSGESDRLQSGRSPGGEITRHGSRV